MKLLGLRLRRSLVRDRLRTRYEPSYGLKLGQTSVAIRKPQLGPQIC
jgi:hypothetical protein